MKIHIIILTYNCLDKTKQCLKFLYKNTKNFKLILLDNGSNNNIEEYIRDIKRDKNNIFFKKEEKNLGIIKGRNSAYKFSKGIEKSDLTIFLDSDQFVLHGWLDNYLKMIKKFDIVGTEAWKMRNDFYPMRKNKNINQDYSYVGSGGMAIKTEVFEKLGLFDESYDFMYFEDPNLCFLANKKGYKIGWNYKKDIIHDHKGSLLSPNNKKYFFNNWEKFKSKWGVKDIPRLKMV